MSFLNTLKQQIKAGYPFAVYRKPNASTVIGFFQQTNFLHRVETFKEEGFIFAPFSKGELLFIPKADAIIEIAAVADLGEMRTQEMHVPVQINEAEQSAFEHLVLRCQEAIAQGQFSKVVPSRKEEIAIAHLPVVEVFKQLLVTYPQAFCSLVYHPAIGLWMGATPESLLSIKRERLFTMALAGTQLNHGREEVVWGEKEKEEQQYVTDFIVESLQPFVNELVVSEPFTKRAARVMHICTTIEATLKQGDLKPIVTALHPTPAVCGMPKASSKAFLLQQEGYDRKYYAGYLGELNFQVAEGEEHTTDLYVNLRCMEVEQQKVNVYVGCGVTKDSDPALEYLETANKATTMKQVLIKKQ